MCVCVGVCVCVCECVCARACVVCVHACMELYSVLVLLLARNYNFTVRTITL